MMVFGVVLDLSNLWINLNHNQFYKLFQISQIFGVKINQIITLLSTKQRPSASLLML